MHFSEKTRLLAEVIENGDYKAFREEMFETGLFELRELQVSRTRAARKKKVLAWISLAASLVAGAILALNWRPGVNLGSNAVDGTKEAVWVRSAALNPASVVRSVPNRSIMVETTGMSSRSLAIVTTRAAVAEANDAELLALFAGKPSGLIRTSQGVQLVILDNHSNRGQ